MSLWCKLLNGVSRVQKQRSFDHTTNTHDKTSDVSILFLLNCLCAPLIIELASLGGDGVENIKNTIEYSRLGRFVSPGIASVSLALFL